MPGSSQSLRLSQHHLIHRFSDARSGQVVDDRIRPTLEAGSTVGSTKPVLLIIDEIDGATGSGGCALRLASSWKETGADGEGEMERSVAVGT